VDQKALIDMLLNAEAQKTLPVEPSKEENEETEEESNE
jgi:hypothetical protein